MPSPDAMRYEDRLSRFGHNVAGTNLARQQLAQALGGSLPVRVVIATSSDPGAVDAFHVKVDLVGWVVDFDGGPYSDGSRIA